MKSFLDDTCVLTFHFGAKSKFENNAALIDYLILSERLHKTGQCLKFVYFVYYSNSKYILEFQLFNHYVNASNLMLPSYLFDRMYFIF